ncbi:MAG: 2-isopropylmalate synthase [Nanoarchaeota archaeon]|nr:2-isopropylmalate synthase [Nanoarchaeota archaeon]
MTNKIIIFDTTLRDGEQASGFHLLKEEKLVIAKQLAKLGVDVIEAGFAASSHGDFESINEIARVVGTKDGPVICALARAIESDIDLAGKALEPAYNKRIHTFIATSDIHIEGKFRKSREWVIETAVNAIKKALTYTNDVEFSCEDFGRSDLEYTVEVVCAAIKAGAKTINLPDTVGWLTPSECYEKVRYVIDNVRGRGLDAVFSVHNHNDFGMATATTIEAIRAGVRQVEVTINGIGERAGNTSLEEIVAILKTKKLGECNVKTEFIGETSQLVSKLTGVYPQPNKAIVGKNAFAHEAGIHQDGVIKEKSTYEIMDPVDFGVESVLTFGPRSGRNALKGKYKRLGIIIEGDEFESVAKRFKEIADLKKEIDDCDLIMAVNGDYNEPEYYKFVSYRTIPLKDGFGCIVKLIINDEKKREYSEGGGQIDCAIKAIRKAISGENIILKEFNSRSLGVGSDSYANTKIIVAKNSWEAKGFSTDTDVVRSAILAFINGANRIRYIEDYFNPSR